MKKFIIGFMCVLLFSCNHVTNPAYADVVEQDSIIFPVSSEKQEYSPCLAIADFSFTAMLAHQSFGFHVVSFCQFLGIYRYSQL